MNDLTKRNGTAVALSDDFADQLGAGIAESRAQTHLSGGGGKPFLTLTKGVGTWVWGQDKEEVQPGSQWAVNVMSFIHGWCCWDDSTGKNVVVEVMDSMARPKPAKPQGSPGKEFSEQRGFELKCLNGDDKGTEVQYKNNSDGGVKAAIALAGEVQKRLAVRENRAYPCPVIELESEWYPHPKWGRTYKPIFNIVGWADMMGNVEGERPLAIDEGAGEAMHAAEAPTTTRIKPRKAPIGTAAAEAAPPVDAPAPTQRQHVGQRRRPAAR